MQYAEIALNAKTSLSRQTFSYKIKPEQLPYIQSGVLVSAPFRNRNLQGVVVSLQHIGDIALKHKLKFIDKILDTNPILDSSGLQLARWMSDYYMTPIGEVIFAMIPSVAHRLASKTLAITNNSSNVPKQNGRIYTLYDRNEYRIKNYIKLIEKALKAKKNSLLIFSTSEKESKTYELLKKYFNNVNIAIFSSNLTNTQKYTIWQEMQRNKYQIVVGTRLAIFAPISNLGLMIIDQPENFGYKEEQSPHYNTRDIALEIVRTRGINLVFGSDTPDIISYYNLNKKYYHNLKQLNENVYQKPDCQLVDMNYEKTFISHILEREIQNSLQHKQKILIVLNRRGSGSVYKCNDCQEVIKCKKCAEPLVFFENSNTLICSHCNTHTAPPNTCPHCQGSKLRSFGIGTQTIEKELKKTFPEIKTLIIERDSANIYNSSEHKNYDCVIATQKILDFDIKFYLTAVLQIDNQFNVPDFTTLENIYLFLTKVINLTNKKLIIQTQNPENFVIRNLQSPAKITNYILDERKKYDYPPFSKIIKLTLRDGDKSKCQKEAEKMYELLKKLNIKLLTILGPNPSFTPKKRGKFYYQITLKHPVNLDTTIKKRFFSIKSLSKWTIDVDPISLL